MTNHTQILLDLIAQQQPHLNKAKNLADVLNITESAAYRKLKGETALTVEEFFFLANKYQIDLNQFSPSQNAFVFKGNLVYNDKAYVEQYFSETKNFLTQIIAGKGVLHNLSKDIPLFYYFAHNELGWFKIFFMLKYILLDEHWAQSSFDMQSMADTLMAQAKSYTETYQQVNTSEVWNLESVNTTLHQLEFACDTNVLNSAELVHKLYTQLAEILFVVQKQAALGNKVNFNNKQKNEASFKLYHNDLYLAHNSYFLEMQTQQYSFVSFGVFNYIFTEDAKFNDYTANHFKNIQSKSISLNSNAIESEKYFNLLHNKLKSSLALCLNKLEQRY